MHKLSRRHVIATLTSSSVLLCPALLNAQVALDWDGIPTDKPVGEDQLITLPAGPVDVDVSTLQPGEVAVIARPNGDEAFSATGQIQYVAIHRRTDAQAAAANDRDGTVQDPNYFVVNLVCSHRGKAIGLTGNPEAPFACTDRGDRHSSDYDVSGLGVAGKSKGDYLTIPEHTLTTDGAVVLSLA